MTSLVAQMVKNLLAMGETQVQFLQDPAFSYFGSGTGSRWLGGIAMWGFSAVTAPFHTPTNSAHEFQFPHILIYTCYFQLYFGSSLLDGCEAVSHCGFHCLVSHLALVVKNQPAMPET